MELRDIEIFLTLAEELHFGRTAERLRLTTARVSQSIKAQERRIGAPLLERTTRTVRLTPLGRQLRRDLGVAHRQITEAVHNAAVVAGGITGSLTLGSMGAQPFTITTVLERFKARHPAAELHIREIQATAPLRELRSGEVDVAQVWLPVHEPDLTVGPVVHTCDVVLMVGADHPFAGRDSVCREDLGDCTVLTGTAVPRSMEQAFHPDATPSGRPIARGPAASSWHEMMSLSPRARRSPRWPPTPSGPTPGPASPTCRSATRPGATGPSSGAPPTKHRSSGPWPTPPPTPTRRSPPDHRRLKARPTAREHSAVSSTGTFGRRAPRPPAVAGGQAPVGSGRGAGGPT